MEKKNPEFIPWLKSLLFDSTKDKKSSKRQYILVVLVIGVGFMLFSNLFFGKEEDSSLDSALPAMNQEETDTAAFSQKDDDKVPSTISDYEARFESQLTEALEAIIGVGDVNVVVNVDASEKQVLQKNVTTNTQTTEEVDKAGGKRSVIDDSKDEEVVIVKNGNDEHPIILETKKPVIRGVLIVAQGAENIHVKQMIYDAVTRVLDVPQHKVAVQPKKSKGE